MRYVYLAFVLLAVLPIDAGARDPEVLQLSPDTYMITRSSKAGMFANMSKLKSKVIKQANEFATSQGKVAIPISERQRRPDVGFPSYEYQFRLVDPDGPEVRPTTLEAGPDQVIQSTNNSDVNVTIKEVSDAKPDLYTELMKLDDLRKKGILTDAEFEQEKKELLESN